MSRDLYDKNFLVLIGVFLIASVVRVVFDNNIYIINIIGGINILSFWYVIYLILDNVREIFYKLLKENQQIGSKIKTKKVKEFKKFYTCSGVIILIIGMVYILFWANSIVNDIIALAALFFSIETDCVSRLIATVFAKRK